jgi:ribosomal protein S12 methylthiotransferase
VSLGCAKNLVDSEKMLGQLAEGGCVVGADLPEADVIVINTCGFLQAAREEAHQAIREALEHKRAGRCRRVVVAGCLVQRDGRSLVDDWPDIDALVGVNNRADLLKAVGVSEARSSRGKRGPRRRGADLYLGDYHSQSWTDSARLRLTPRHFAYLRISEGCDQKCTFCTIPAIRGPLYSKPVAEVLNEARELIEDGAVELNIIGQDTTSYGKDIDYRPGLAGLLKELNKLDGLRWLRLLYAYPSEFTGEMIDAVAECDKVVKYVDVPLQHINDRILRAMYRRVTRRQTEALLDKLRDRIPGVVLRTTLIAGFPGETEAEFSELLEFVRERRFEALGVFPFSREPDTPAGRMKGQLAEEVAQERADALMSVQQEVAFERNRGRVGAAFDVLVESQIPDDQGRLPARAVFQAPQVDGITRLSTAAGLTAGNVVRARCSGWDRYDLIARPTGVMLPVVDRE